MPHTYLSQSFSTYEIPTVSNGVYSTGHSDERAIELMAYMRTTLAGRAVLGNNELGRGPGDNDAVYAYQRNVGSPLYYQLDGLDRLSNLAGHPVDKWTVNRQPRHRSRPGSIVDRNPRPRLPQRHHRVPHRARTIRRRLALQHD